MCNLVEEYAKKYAEQQSIENAINLLKNGVSVDIIADSIPSLSRDLIVSLSKKIPQTTKL